MALAAQCIYDQAYATLPSDLLNHYYDTKLNLPGCEIYYFAGQILSGNHDHDIVLSFVKLLGQIQGSKLSKHFIFKTIDKLLSEDLVLDEISRYFIIRWKNLYNQKIEGNQETRLKSCDYHLCEAACCYDGVYLSAEDEMKINQAIAHAPDFFSHLPAEPITNSTWKNISGRKTQTRPYWYKSPDYPTHFNQTRCVFAFETGACSLQRFAMQTGDDPWKYKPEACKIHPLQVSGKDFFAPPNGKENDKHNLGINYPGYVSFTPCGQNRQDGQVWFNALDLEITTFKKSFGQEHNDDALNS